MNEEEVKIYNDYISGLTYKEICERNNTNKDHLKYLIKKYKWKRENIHKGGCPEGNKNAVVTGAYEKLFWDCLDDDEKEIYNNFEIDIYLGLREEINLLTIRETRMMKRIKELKNKERDLTITGMIKDDEGGVSTRASSTLLLIQKIEEGLNKVQIAKQKALVSLKKMQEYDLKLDGNSDFNDSLKIDSKECDIDSLVAKLSIEELRKIIDDE